MCLIYIMCVNYSVFLAMAEWWQISSKESVVIQWFDAQRCKEQALVVVFLYKIPSQN